MLQLTDITLHRGDKELFAGLDLTVYSGHKAGVVGRNGVGKTTLFEVIRGRVLPEEGVVSWPESWRLAWLDQHVRPSPRSALDFTLDGDRRLREVERAIQAAQEAEDDDKLAVLYTDFEDAGGYDAHARGGEVLSGLGFAADDFAKPHRAFSGGWRIRLNLARALMTPSELLLLDEPTNHLDLEATLWLESWLQKYRGTLLTIAHDRDFLDRSVGEIVHLEGGRAVTYTGNYSAFELQRAETLTRQAAVRKRQQQRVAEIQRFVDRFRAKDSKAKQVQSRLKALQRMELVAEVHAESPYRFAFTQPKKVSNPTLSLDEASLGYNGKPVLEDITLRVYPGDRIGVLGANGAGKTTLLRCLAGDLAPLSGELTRGRHSAIGYFAQHQLESLDFSRSPLDHLTDRGDFTSQSALDYLGGWGFGGGDATRPAETFSGGEKARLVLALIACGAPAVLVLDEPTNHLDLDMREALALALQHYQGAMLLVSHDRHLLRRCVDSLWLVADGQVGRFADDLDNYTAYTARPAQRSARSPSKSKPAQSRRRRADSRRLRQRQRDLEARIDAENVRIEELQRRQVDLATSNQGGDFAELAKAHKQSLDALRRAEQAWLKTQEQLDSIES